MNNAKQSCARAIYISLSMSPFNSRFLETQVQTQAKSSFWKVKNTCPMFRDDIYCKLYFDPSRNSPPSQQRLIQPIVSVFPSHFVLMITSHPCNCSSRMISPSPLSNMASVLFELTPFSAVSMFRYEQIIEISSWNEAHTFLPWQRHYPHSLGQFKLWYITGLLVEVLSMGCGA